MNKLRGLAASSAVLLGGFAAWAFLAYHGAARPLPYLLAAGVALALPVVPRVAARAKLAGLRAIRCWRGGSEFSDERGTVFRSVSTVERHSLFETVEAVVADAPEFDGVRTDEFDEGEGLVVTHAGFHALFVRVTEEGHAVVTGASKRSRRLADRLEDVASLTFERVASSPLLDPEPVRGGPRVLLAAGMLVATAGGAAAVTHAAYPGGTYNTAEKATLVSMDARAAADPGVSETDLKLQKAALLVSSIREEAVEIRLRDARVEGIRADAVEALETDAAVRRLLRSARAGSLTDRQASRADALEADLRDADRRVATAIVNRTRGDVEDPDGTLEGVREQLLAASRTPVNETGEARSRP